MSKDNSGWDAIPSLEGLEIDWDFEPESPLGKRAYARMTVQELYPIFKVREIPVKFVTEKDQFSGMLLDISQGGVSLSIQHARRLKESQLIKVGFLLGDRKFISKGRIRNIRPNDDEIVIGIEFVGLSAGDSEFICGLYPSIKIK